METIHRHFLLTKNNYKGRSRIISPSNMLFLQFYLPEQLS